MHDSARVCFLVLSAPMPQVMVKEHMGNFERSRCIGEIIIKLDGLNLTSYTLGWYRLFAPCTVELGSAESLHLL